MQDALLLAQVNLLCRLVPELLGNSASHPHSQTLPPLRFPHTQMKRPLSSIEPPPTWPEALRGPARQGWAATCLDAACLAVGLGLILFVALNLKHSL